MFVTVLGVAAFVGDAAIRRGAGALTGAVRWIAWALAATAVLLAVHIVPLALGVLSRATVIVACAVAFAAGVALARAARRRGIEPAAAVARGPVLLGAAAMVAALGAALGLIRADGADPVLSFDALNYQLPQVARWMQSGSLWQLDQMFPDYSNATYPHHGNVLLLAAMLPVSDDTLARLVPIPYAGLAALAVYAAALELGAARGWALLAAAMPLAIPIFVRVALEGTQTDPPFYFFFTAGALFLLRHHRTAARADLVLAGLALGLALGTKWYALTTIPVLLVVWAVARRRGRLRWWRDGVRLVVLIALAGGIWLVRNLVETGNPVFPQPLGPFDAPADPLRDQLGWTLLHYLTDLDAWREYLVGQFTDFIGAPGYVLAAAGVVAVAVAWRRRDGRALAVAAAALACIVAYAATPYSAFGPEGRPVVAYTSMRYAVPALLLCAIVLAWLGTLAPRPAAVAVAVAVGLGLIASYDIDLGLVAASTAGLAAAVLVGRRLSPRTAVAAGLVVVGLATLHIRDLALGRNYARYDPAYSYIEAVLASDSKIMLAGVWPLQAVAPGWPAFGATLGNEVEYMGTFVDGMLRATKGETAFTRQLRASGADALIVGRGQAGGGVPAPEEEWARAAGFETEAASDGLALLVRQ